MLDFFFAYTRYYMVVVHDDLLNRYRVEGMQGPPIYGAEPNGLSLSEKLLPEYLKELGYTTRAVGKWHLGYYKLAYTPTRRGFDSHFGYYTGYVSYYDYILQDMVSSWRA